MYKYISTIPSNIIIAIRFPIPIDSKGRNNSFVKTVAPWRDLSAPIKTKSSRVDWFVCFVPNPFSCLSTQNLLTFTYIYIWKTRRYQIGFNKISLLLLGLRECNFCGAKYVVLVWLWDDFLAVRRQWKVTLLRIYYTYMHCLEFGFARGWFYGKHVVVWNKRQSWGNIFNR